MNTRKRILGWTFALAILLSATGLGQAQMAMTPAPAAGQTPGQAAPAMTPGQGMMGGGMMGGGMMGGGMMSGGMMCGPGMGGQMMSLTPEQQAAAQKLHADFTAKTADTRKQLTSKHFELAALLYAASPDEKKIQAVTKEISELRAKLFEAHVALQGQLIKAGLPAMGHMGMEHMGM